MPGAVATMLLSDYGAEVVKVERVGGSPSWRDATRTWDRGKRSIAVDLTDPDELTVLRALASGADVLLHDCSFRRIQRLGLRFEDVRAAAPSIVYCAISPYGQSGCSGDMSGYDALVAAKLGLMSEWGGHRDGPIFLGHPGLGYSTGLVAAISVLAGLRARLVTGRGDLLDVSLRDGMLAQMAMNWWSERNISFIKSKARGGALDLGNQRLLLAMFECADGELIQVHTGARGGFGRAMSALGLGAEISPAENEAAEGSTPLTDDDLVIIRERVPAVFRSKPRNEWLSILWEYDVAALPVQRPGQALDDEQVRFIGLVQQVVDADIGRIETVGPVIKLDPGSVLPISGPAPCVDGDGDALRRSGWRGRGLAKTNNPRPLVHPLDGIRVAEFSNWFAGPYGNRLLADLGADVIKVEPLYGEAQRPLPNPFEGSNRGKRDMSIDLKSPRAHEVITRLLASVDVVQHNMRPGAAERLQIDSESVGSINPSVVYSYSPGYGSVGPKAHLQSFAPLLSGFSGIAMLAAGAGNRPQTTFGNEDSYNGLVSAFGILLGLVHRERTGQGLYVECPQLHSIMLATSEWYKQDGEYRSTLPSLDHEQTGWGPGYRLYQCLSGWICVACADDTRFERLVKAVLPPDVAHDRAARPEDPAKLGVLLQYHFFGRSAEEWRNALTDAGVPCELAREDSWLEEFLNDRAMIGSGLVRDEEHPVYGRIRTIGPIFHMMERPARIRSRAPLLGEHTAEVLSEIGLSANAISDLAAEGVVGNPL
jgi:crotonobetainyl-CoA:carnitine CoA-transferase CaiB-like acyl-CoA transferase